MLHTGRWQRVPGQELLGAGPEELALPAPTREPLYPGATDLVMEVLQAPAATADTEVAVVPSDLLADHAMLLPEWIVPMDTTPAPDRLQRAGQPTRHRLALHDPASLARLPQ